jgi:hypothetical protein
MMLTRLEHAIIPLLPGLRPRFLVRQRSLDSECGPPSALGQQLAIVIARIDEHHVTDHAATNGSDQQASGWRSWILDSPRWRSCQI